MPSYTKQPNLPGGTEASPPCPEGDPRVPSAARSDWNPRTETGDTPELSDPSAKSRAVSKEGLLWKGQEKAASKAGMSSLFTGSEGSLYPLLGVQGSSFNRAPSRYA